MRTILITLLFAVGSWSSQEIQDLRLYVNATLPRPEQAVEPRIINGWESEPHSIPYQAYLLLLLTTGQLGACGGVLISTLHVLTAAHCLTPTVEVTAYLGAHNVQLVESTQVRVTTRNFKYHQDYYPSLISDDIGVVIFNEPVQLNEYINVARLPSRGESTDFVGQNARASGWGFIATHGPTSPVLREVNSTIITNEACRHYYYFQLDSQICISGVGNVGICSGDSGGPLVVGNTLVGLSSYMISNCWSEYPSVFSRVSSYLDWIQENTGLEI